MATTYVTLSDGTTSFIGPTVRSRPARFPSPTLPHTHAPTVYTAPANALMLTRRSLVENDHVLDPQTKLECRVIRENGRLVMAPISGGEFRMEINGAWASLPVFLLPAEIDPETALFACF